jgi:hypothetical protein
MRLRVLGAVLALYGVVGVLVFVVVAVGVARPLDRARQLSESIDSDRAAVVQSLTQAETTIREMSTGVGRMDTSLADAKSAIDRASTISHGVATSMYGLRDAMNVSIFGAQPLSGLSGSFDTSGQGLDALGDDISSIGTALDANRADAATTATNLVLLADSVHTLTGTVEAGPSVAISTSTLDEIKLAIYLVAGWLVFLALGCLAAGVYLLNRSRSAATDD